MLARPELRQIRLNRPPALGGRVLGGVDAAALSAFPSDTGGRRTSMGRGGLFKLMPTAGDSPLFTYTHDGATSYAGSTELPLLPTHRRWQSSLCPDRVTIGTVFEFSGTTRASHDRTSQLYRMRGFASYFFKKGLLWAAF